MDNQHVWAEEGEPYSKLHAWLYLLMHANYTDGNVIVIKGKKITLNIGELGRSEVTLAKDWKWSRGRVRRYLLQLKNEGMILQKTVQVTSVISICNYSLYQDGGTSGGTAHGTVDGTAHGTQVNKDNKIIIDICDETSDMFDTDKPPTVPSQPPVKRKGSNVPPAMEELTSYFITQGSDAGNAERFFDYYDASNWHRGKTKIKNWQGSARTWIKNNYNNSTLNQPSNHNQENAY